MEDVADIRETRAASYESARPDVQAHVPAEARNVLELGCSNGALGAALKARQDVAILGVELSEDYAAEARERLDRVVVGDAESFLAGPPPPEAPFDCLICADLLEHLADPWAAMRRAAELLQPGATAVISLPNVLFAGALRRVVMERRWPREDDGIFDGTHLRWFSRTDAEELLRQAGLEPVWTEPRYWRKGRALRVVQGLARTPLEPYLAPQYVISARKR